MLRYIPLFVACLLLGLKGLGQSDSTSTPQELATAVVKAQIENVRWTKTPSQTIKAKVLKRFAASDFTPGMNRIPGVRFEQRTPGSYRVSIRNTARRSPFGVRDVQVYWNGIPLTEPGGDTPLNFIDLTNVDAAVVTKGPNSLSSGSPLGGTVEFKTLPNAPNQIGGQFGEFSTKAGYGKFTVRDSNEAKLHVRVAHRSTNGHRDWSNFRRTTAQISLYNHSGTKSPFGWNFTSETHALATRLDYNLPGALTPDQYSEQPYASRPGSIESRASIDYENLFAGTTFEAKRNLWTIRSTGYLTGFRFDNPFNINHKRETNFGFGGRASIRRDLVLGSQSFLEFGGEGQQQFRDSRQFDPNGGVPGDLQFNDEISSQRWVGYAEVGKTIGNLNSGFYEINAGLSAQKVRYAVDRNFERGGARSTAGSDFDLFFAPRISLSRRFSRGAITVLAARGSSNPTLREFRTNDGGLNRDLRPEEGTSFEVFGIWQPASRIEFRANAYLTRLSQTITTFQDTSGVQLFRNAGRTRQPGVEFAIDWQLTKAINISPAYTYQPYTYREYEVDGVSFAGRPMPGLPRHTADVLLHADFPKGIYSDFNLRYESENPLDDAGDVVADDFILFRLQVGVNIKGYHLFIAGDNLLDVVYSLGNDINPQFGNRYFQAAPPRNVNVGVSFNF